MAHRGSARQFRRTARGESVGEDFDLSSDTQGAKGQRLCELP